MKSFKNIYQAICFTGLLALSTSSCTDWLTIYPQDRVVEENFWEDKNDLEGVRYGAYRQMASTVSQFAVWGDLRSDSYSINSVDHSDQKNRNTYIEIIQGMPDSSMSVFDWGGVYTTINYCNKVLSHGAEVLAKDKQFTSGEWIQMEAEMTALRALNYFYLIRAFKDVPYTTKVINKDAEVEDFPLTNQLVVLDSIINDCERVKGKARNRFSAKRDSKGMITNCAIYAMLADMYLWRGSLHEGRHGRTGTDIVNGESVSHDVYEDYRKSAEYADLCLASLANQTREERTGGGLSTIADETVNYGLSNCDMIKNDFEGAAQATVPSLEAQTAIFNYKNSRESIFELQYSVSDGLKNTVVNSLYGFGNGTHLMVNKDALDAIYDGGVTGVGDNGGMWDSRTWIGCQNKLIPGSSISTETSAQAQAGYYCMKYQLLSEKPLNMDGASDSREIKSIRYTSTEYNNWIVYRMTDVMLIKAEALACQGTSTANQVNAICNAVHRRSYCNFRNSTKIPDLDATRGTLGNARGTAKNQLKSGVSLSASIVMVLNERQIEFLGEGKRWFDLVRLAERCSSPQYKGKDDPDDPREPGVKNGQTGMKTMVEAFLGTGSGGNLVTTLTNRFKNRYGLYCPIYYMEVKASNGAVEQNPVWNKSKYEQ